MVTRHNSRSVSGQQTNAINVESSEIRRLLSSLTRYGQVEDEEIAGGAHYRLAHHSNDDHDVSYCPKNNQHTVHGDEQMVPWALYGTVVQVLLHQQRIHIGRNGIAVVVSAIQQQHRVDLIVVVASVFGAVAVVAVDVAVILVVGQ